MYRREVDALAAKGHQFFAGVRDTAAAATERERGTKDERESNLGREFKSIFKVVDERRARHVEADLGHRIFEQQAVFGFLDCAKLRADEDYAVLIEHAAVGEVHGEVQRGL